jgi:hypothetical protein
MLLQVLQAMPPPRRRLVIFKAGGYVYRCAVYLKTFVKATWVLGQRRQHSTKHSCLRDMAGRVG